MKKLRKLLVLIVILLFACKRNDKPKNQAYNGYSLMIFNNMPTDRFKVRVNYLDSKEYLIITFLYAINDLYERETFSFVNVKINNNLQKVMFANLDNSSLNNELYSRFFTLSNGGDVLCHIFDVLENNGSNNWIKINNYNKITKKIEGEFCVTFIKTRECDSFIFPDTIKIKSGYFDAIIE